MKPRKAPQVLKRNKVDREDRIKTRQQLGPLEGLLLPPRTQTWYFAALRRFFFFADRYYPEYMQSAGHLDNTVAAYIEALWQDGDPRYWGRTRSVDSHDCATFHDSFRNRGHSLEHGKNTSCPNAVHL